MDALRKWRWKLKLFFWKVVWMLVTVLAPEYLVSQALAERLSAGWSCEKLRRWAEEDGVEWTMTHSFFADMGGFVIRFTDGTPEAEGGSGTDSGLGKYRDASTQTAEAPASPEPPGEGVAAESEISESPPGGASLVHHVETPPIGVAENTPVDAREHAALATETIRQDEHPPPARAINDPESGPTPKSMINQILSQQALLSVKHDTLAQNISCLRGNAWSVDAAQLLLARELGLISALPAVTEEELEDQSKADVAVRALAIVQVSWMMFQQLERGVKHLPSSQLEIVVLAFAACAGVVYGLRWCKPKDVQTPRYVDASRYPRDADELARVGVEGPAQSWVFWSDGVSAISNVAVHRYKEKVYPHAMLRVAVGGFFASTVFGLLHCIAWNFEFPTPTERLLWRVAAVGTAAIPSIAWVASLAEVDRYGRAIRGDS
ncbi:hypothetical protein FGG08_007177 [Glutinoglossum americanum]|uniref:Uncharacterized protein n=1 Tax=Glutinoglossum americanum TaxID=1670608 RepID=A0A9P8I5W2_9PEZI|nr:hypothetical protein FGG08_007177 [Glutinoglossum americanum]